MRRTSSINKYGEIEIPVLQRCVTGMIEHAVRKISVIKKYLYTDIQSNFVKMKQEPQVYNITSDKLEFVRNTLKII